MNSSFLLTHRIRPWIVGAALFVLFFSLFLSLHSQHYMAVDGTVRSVEVFRNASLRCHGNNHMRYPFWVRQWAGLAASVGIVPKDGFAFIRITEGMNAFLAAATITVLYTLFAVTTESGIALLCALMFGFSTAVTLHATNAAEPLAGLFFSVLGIRLLVSGLLRNAYPMLVVAGISFALGLASYQAMGSVAAVAAFICIWWPQSPGTSGFAARHAVARLLWVALGGMTGVCIVYGWVYHQQGIPLQQMPLHFVSLTGADVYSGFRASKVLNLPFGMIRSLDNGLPLSYSGIRSLLAHSRRAVWIPLIAGE